MGSMTNQDKVADLFARIRHWAALAIRDAGHVIEISMEERGVRALGIAYQVDASRLLNVCRHRVRAEAWKVRKDLEQDLHDGKDPTEFDE